MDRSSENQDPGTMRGDGSGEAVPGTPAGSAQGGVQSMEHRSPPQTGEVSISQGGGAVEGEPTSKPDAGNSALNGLRDANHTGG